MLHPDPPDAGTGSGHEIGFAARRVHLQAVTWERIQLSLRLRPSDGRLLVGSTLRLRRGDGLLAGPSVEMAPTHIEADDSWAAVRFNVMQGPGQMPLAVGRWILEASETGSASAAQPIVIEGVGTSDAGPALPAARFDFSQGRYTVSPSLDPESGSLRLDVGLEPGLPSDSAGPLGPSWVRRLRRSTRRLRPGLFGVLFRVLRAIPVRNGQRILFSSDSRTELGGNLKIVFERMVELGLDREYRLSTLFKNDVAAPRTLLDRLRLPWRLARADVIVVDDYQPIIYRVDDRGMKIVQLWHAWGAFKTVGYSRVGKPGGPNPYSRVHKNYSYATVSSTSEVSFYAEAFGIPESRVIPTGIPRMDQFFDPGRREASRAAAQAAYPAARDRMTILFAPTFRGHGARSAWYDLALIDYAGLHAVCVEKDAICIIRMHPFVRTPLRIPEAYADRIIDGSGTSIDVNDLLFAVDLLITDYSSVVFEFSTMDKPMLFFAYDLEDYVATRDFYVDYAEFVPGRIVRTFDALLDAIRREDYDVSRLEAFRASHLDHFDGRATDRVIDLILGR